MSSPKSVEGSIGHLKSMVELLNEVMVEWWKRERDVDEWAGSFIDGEINSHKKCKFLLWLHAYLLLARRLDTRSASFNCRNCKVLVLINCCMNSYFEVGLCYSLRQWPFTRSLNPTRSIIVSWTTPLGKTSTISYGPNHWVWSFPKLSLYLES